MKSIVRLSVCVGWLLVAAQALADDQIQWAPDFRTACGMAAEQRRLVLLHFYNDNCGPCVRLEQNVFCKSEVGEAVAQNYVAVKVHAGKQPQLASRYRVNQWPTDVFVTPSGLEVHRAISDQDPGKYIAVLNQVAQRTGVGASRQWKSQLTQTSHDVTAAAAGTMNQAGADAERFAQRAGGEFQTAASQAQQRWNQTAGQFQEAVGQSRLATQDAIGAATQTAVQVEQQAATAVAQSADKATQWSQQATNAVQQYQQQAGDSYRDFRTQAEGTRQDFERKMELAKQDWRESTQKATQEVGGAAQSLKNQLQQASQSLLDRRSAFVPAEHSPSGDAAHAHTTALTT